jgi:small subunit ribosomal protein S8
MVTDVIADLLTRIRNASAVGHPTVNCPASTTKEAILRVLKAEGYIAQYEKLADDRNIPFFKIYLRYSDTGRPVVKEIRRYSRPGKRVYVPSEEIPMHKGGLGLIVVSTSKGMLSGKEAKKLGIGGELICSVF